MFFPTHFYNMISNVVLQWSTPFGGIQRCSSRVVRSGEVVKVHVRICCHLLCDLCICRAFTPWNFLFCLINKQEGDEKTKENEGDKYAKLRDACETQKTNGNDATTSGCTKFLSIFICLLVVGLRFLTSSVGDLINLGTSRGPAYVSCKVNASDLDCIVSLYKMENATSDCKTNRDLGTYHFCSKLSDYFMCVCTAAKGNMTLVIGMWKTYSAKATAESETLAQEIPTRGHEYYTCTTISHSRSSHCICVYINRMLTVHIAFAYVYQQDATPRVLVSWSTIKNW